MNAQTNPERKCLSRTDWIISLQKAFETTAASNTQVSIEAFQRFLIKSVASDEIRLTETNFYNKAEVCLTYQQVLEKLSVFQGPVSWDQILEILVSKPYVYFKKPRQFQYPAITPETHCNILNEHLLDLSPSIIYLNLSTSALESLPNYPQTIRILNISNNVLTHLTLEPGLEFLNASQNLLESLQILKPTNTQECFFKDNKLSSVPNFSKMPNLRVLDLSLNTISSCEDLSLLVLNRKLEVFCCKDNPVVEENEKFVETLFGHVARVNVENCFEFSKCPHMSVLVNQGNGHKRNFTLPLDFNRLPEGRGPCRANYAMSGLSGISGFSGMSGFSGESSPTGYTLVNKSVSYHFSPFSKENMEKRANRSMQRRSPSTVITPQNIAKAVNIKYGNPIAALMIKPSYKRRLTRKKSSN